MKALRSNARAENADLDVLNDKLRQDQGLVCADNAALKARIAELEDHAVLATLAKNNDALRARIAELEAWKATCREVDCYRVSADKGTLQALRDANDRMERAEAQLLAERSTAAYKDVRIERAEAELTPLKIKLAGAEAQRDGLQAFVDRALLEKERAEAERDAMRETLLGLNSAASVLLDEAMGFSASGVYFSEKCMGHKGPDLVATAIDKASAVLNCAALAPSPAGREG